MLKTFSALCIFYPVNEGEGWPSYVAGTFSVLSFYIGFTTSFRVSQGFSSSFLLCSKNMNTGLTGGSKLPLGASVSEWCVSCDGLASGARWFSLLLHPYGPQLK